MSTSGTRDGVEAMLDECELMWATSNIPPRRAQEMRAELGQHVREATKNGKSVEDVVGDDATIFALEWAREIGPPRSVKREVIDLTMTFLIYAALVPAVYHLVTLSVSFGVRWYAVALVTVPTLGGILITSPRIAAVIISIKPRWKRELSVFLLLAAVIGLPAAVAALGPGVGGVLFEWSWPATVLAGVGAISLWVLRDDPNVPGYEDVEPEPFVVDRAFVIVAVVVPLSTLAAIVASSLEPRLVFALWWGVPGACALLLPPENAANWRRFGAASLGLAALLTAVMLLVT